MKWYNGYNDLILDEGTFSSDRVVVIFGMEQVIKKFLIGKSVEEARESFREWLQVVLKWESKSKDHQLYLVGSDIGKGIVPMNAFDRNWRDVVGWCYQDIVSHAKVVQLIWYGLNQELKIEEEQR